MIRFCEVRPWAILPHKATMDLTSARQRASMYREQFRYVRANRQPEFCAPWVLGRELGWRISSPIDVTIDPLRQIEVDPGDDPTAALKASGKSELWMRERTAIAVDRPSWLHLYQFRSGDQWENMFVPNGADSVEWRLGWAVDGVDSHSMLVMPSEGCPDLGVQVGVLTAGALQRMREHGCSVPISPRRSVSVRRGDEIARIVVLHPDSLSRPPIQP